MTKSRQVEQYNKAMTARHEASEICTMSVHDLLRCLHDLVLAGGTQSSAFWVSASWAHGHAARVTAQAHDIILKANIFSKQGST